MCCQQRRRQDVHAVLVEEAQKLRLLRFLEENNNGLGFGLRNHQLSPCGFPAHISRRQHVLWVNQCPEKPHQLDGTSQLGVRITNHLLDHHVDQQNILESGG